MPEKISVNSLNTAPNEIIDPWKGTSAGTASVVPEIVNPWSGIPQTGSKKPASEGEIVNPWANAAPAIPHTPADSYNEREIIYPWKR
jgi:hypothetical protein